MNFTVLIPVFNTVPAHLMEAVYSIRKQKGSHRMIIIDDGSDNAGTLLCLDYLKRTGVCEVVHKNNGGTSDALNFGHEMVDTEFVAIMGSDDISHASRFEMQMHHLKNDTSIDVIGTNLFCFYDDDIYRKSILSTKHKYVPDGLDGSKNWLVNHGTVIYRNSAVLAAGGYDVKFRRGQDVDLWRRMKANGCVFRNATEVLYAWRRFKAK